MNISFTWTPEMDAELAERGRRIREYEDRDDMEGLRAYYRELNEVVSHDEGRDEKHGD